MASVWGRRSLRLFIIFLGYPLFSLIYPRNLIHLFMHLIVMDKPIHVRAACITTTTSFLMPVFSCVHGVCFDI